MHQSLPMAIQQQQRLEQQRLEQHRLYVEQQERLKRERKDSLQYIPRGPHIGSASQEPQPTSQLREMGPALTQSPMAAAARAVTSGPGPLSACDNPTVSFRSAPSPHSAHIQVDSSGSGPYLSSNPGAISSRLNASNVPPAVSRSESFGMLVSLRLPPPGIFDGVGKENDTRQ